MTAEDLIPIFKALSEEEQYKFMGITEILLKPKKTRIAKSKKPVLTEEEAIRYLKESVFNK